VFRCGPLFREIPAAPCRSWFRKRPPVAADGRFIFHGSHVRLPLLRPGNNRSILDLNAMAGLGQVNGDLERVAGLLKLWLAEKRGQDARPVGTWRR